MDAGTILTNLQTQLEDSNYLTYIKNVYLGSRDNNIAFPCIQIEPANEIERDYTYNQQELELHIALMAIIKTRHTDNQIVGKFIVDPNTGDYSTAIYGVADVFRDIKQAIGEDRTLDGACEHVRIIDTDFNRLIEDPIRMLAIEIVAEYTQNSADR